jgi:hypothetical protein
VVRVHLYATLDSGFAPWSTVLPSACLLALNHVQIETDLDVV